jgi:hypothetical protein
MINRKLRSNSFYFALLLLAAMGLGSCYRLGERSLKLPSNPILTGGLGWAVVKEAYVRLKESPSDSSRDLDHLRRGGVFRLDARELARDTGAASAGADDRSIWYGVESEGAKGWVRESELDIFESEAQAEKAAASYR